ncbi:MAG TPA: class I SAM-dependent methyltransferase [Gaiellaceae bacterium]|nr:class I SAM-dependent methyltransferase [Gaiellaceae bacterium]
MLGYDGGLDYWRTKQTGDPYWAEAKRRYFLSALALLPRGRLLDLGGGIGEFAGIALEEGWDAYSFDTSPEATAAAQERLGERALAVPAGGFDVVTLWCVVAHLLEPGQLLESARTSLRAGGTLWLTTPNFAFQRRYARLLALVGRPLMFGTGDDHIWHFTADSLRRLLEAHGFADIRFHYRGVIEWCSTGASSARPLIAGKRAWNAVVYAAYRVGLPLATSELQVTARVAR